MSPVQQGQFVQQLKLDQKRIWDHWFNRSRRFSTSELLKVYRGPFLKAVNQISAERKPRFRVDPRLLEKASQRGELVVFNPYPVLELLSDVRSRGYCRIDGDELIRRIAAHKGKRPMVIQSIPYCKESQDMQIRTQNQLTALLAERVRVRKASVSRFLHELTALAHEQLENFGKFKLEGIGTISRGTSRKPIKFTPSTTLKVKAKGAEHLRRRPA
jgi:nucleoid DNA-binding protein